MADTEYEDNGNVTRATFLEFVQRYKNADEAVAEAVGERKSLRAEIKGAGLNLKAFDRMRRDVDKSGDVRDQEDEDYRQMMIWMDKPVGFQGSLDINQITESDMSEIQQKRIEKDGFAHGKRGDPALKNPWSPRTYPYELWLNSYRSGAAERESEKSKDEPKKKSSRTPTGRPRGRPRRDANGRSLGVPN